MNGYLGLAPQPRLELNDAVRSLEQALAAARTRALGSTELRDVLDRIRRDVLNHVSVTEGDHGLYRDVIRSSPRLAHAVRRLAIDHAYLRQELDEVLAMAANRLQDGGFTMDRTCERVRVLMRHLARHRQREADLLYEAYETDLGGET